MAGGDGTINEAVNGLAGARLPLAIVPLGTANVLAAEIGLPTDPRSVARTIALGRPRPISVGVANGRRFLLMAGTGFDAHVVQHVDLALKRRIGKAAYGISILRQLLALRLSRIRRDDRGQTCKAASVLVANAHYYGGRFVCAPAADLRTPTLEVCLFERRGRLSVIGYALAMFTGRLPKLNSYRIVSADKVQIGGGERRAGAGRRRHHHPSRRRRSRSCRRRSVWSTRTAAAVAAASMHVATPPSRRARDSDRIAAYTPRR